MNEMRGIARETFTADIPRLVKQFRAVMRSGNTDLWIRNRLRFGPPAAFESVVNPARLYRVKTRI
jgi:hypothetical protein